MSAYDDPVAHIRALEAEVERLRGKVRRVEELANDWTDWRTWEGSAGERVRSALLGVEVAR